MDGLGTNLKGIYKMRIAAISNNYGKTYDGVGNYAQIQNTNYPEWIKYKVYTADCTYDVSSFIRIFGMGMFKAICRAVNEFDAKKFDVVVLEYPFVEWNPLILIPLICLQKKCRRRKKKFVLSLHEYSRVNLLRKKIIEKLCRLSDLVLVANEDMAKSVSGFAKKTAIRPIPTNLYNESIMKSIITKSKNNFVYFGLVNRAKAFDAMLSAWDNYNWNGKKTLFIITSTFLENIENNHKGIKYLYNQDDETILSIMRSCVACFLPIIPEVDMKNTTFKTGSITGCICIGKFCPKYQTLPFVINMKSYKVSEFMNALDQIDSYSDDTLESLENEASRFGEKYSPKVTATIVANKLRTLMEE